MGDEYSERFMEYLERGDLEGVRAVPKADLHNHFVFGGSREYIQEKTGIYVPVLKGNLRSMKDMHDWVGRHVGDLLETGQERSLLIEAAVYQAKYDGVKVLEIGEDVWANGMFYGGDVSLLIESFHAARRAIMPDLELRLQIGISRHCRVENLQKWLEPFWEHREFYSLDLSGDEMAQPIAVFAPIYGKAKKHGLRLKAHVGEWGSADDVVEAVKVLALDEVQHGIAAAASHKAMSFLTGNGIRLNICPSSNVRLGRVPSLAKHPIGTLFRAGVDVTVNSDDLLIFDSDVSKEFIRLHEQGTLTAKELDAIRVSGLRSVVRV